MRGRTPTHDEVGALRLAIAETRGRCRELGEVVSYLERLGDEVTPAPFDVIRRAVQPLLHHSRDTEPPTGCLGKLAEIAPEYSDRVRLLQTDHLALTDRARRLVDAAREEPDGRQTVQREARRLLGRIAAHRTATLALVEDIEAMLTAPGRAGRTAAAGEGGDEQAG